MIRLDYFNFIDRKLSELGYRIEVRGGGLNLLDLHLHSEDFYQHFINLLFDWKLKNLNAVQPNAQGIDLVDTTNSIVVQVSATATKQKIESALGKLSTYAGYSFKFISISKDAGDLRSKVFANPHLLKFSPAEDILDIKSILAFIKNLPAEKMEKVYDFLKRELKSEPESEKVESNLATIIKILSKEDWGQEVLKLEVIPYDIEAKISHNKLVTARTFIDDYKIHYHRIDKIYSDFDKQGVNKSISILNGIQTEYLALGEVASPDAQFFSVVEKIKARIQSSANYTSMPDEELELCVQILVVDAFIRCKIFKNPLGSTNAHS